MMRRYRYVFLNLIITIFISLCSIGCCGCLKKLLGYDVDSKYGFSNTKEKNEIKWKKLSEIKKIEEDKDNKKKKNIKEDIKGGIKDGKKEDKEDKKKENKDNKNKDEIKKEKKEEINKNEPKPEKNKKEDKEEDPLIEKRKEYFKNTPIIKDQYAICNKCQDLTKYKINNYKILKDVIDEVNKVKKEEDRIFIQSDTEGKVFNIISALQIANIIDINKEIIVYYNFYNGKFEKNKNENSIELKLFKVNKDFKGTYIHLGDIVDRCNGEYQCLKSLLLILYIKQELGDKVKLICGNHELMYSGEQPLCACIDGYPFADGEKRINFITRLICLTAISKGQIQYLDEIEIGNTNYILTHKVLYKDDIGQIKTFLKERMKEEKELDNYGTSDLINVVNDNFKKCFCGIFNNLKNKNYLNEIINKTSMFDHLNGKIVIGERFDKVGGYKVCLDDQICGHDHHKIDDCYIKGKNILFVDNFSYDEETWREHRYQKLLVNIHFFDKNKELSKHKAFKIINDKGNLEIKIIDNFVETAASGLKDKKLENIKDKENKEEKYKPKIEEEKKRKIEEEEEKRKKEEEEKRKKGEEELKKKAEDKKRLEEERKKREKKKYIQPPIIAHESELPKMTFEEISSGKLNASPHDFNFEEEKPKKIKDKEASQKTKKGTKKRKPVEISKSKSTEKESKPTDEKKQKEETKEVTEKPVELDDQTKEEHKENKRKEETSPELINDVNKEQKPEEEPKEEERLKKEEEEPKHEENKEEKPEEKEIKIEEKKEAPESYKKLVKNIAEGLILMQFNFDMILKKQKKEKAERLKKEEEERIRKEKEGEARRREEEERKKREEEERKKEEEEEKRKKEEEEKRKKGEEELKKKAEDKKRLEEERKKREKKK